MNRRDREMSDPIPAARDLFDRASDRLDIATANRLRMARRDALATPPARHHWLRATTALAAALVLGIVWWAPTHAPSPVPTASVATSAPDDLVTPSDEDADLYAWLGDAPVAPDQSSESL